MRVRCKSFHSEGLAAGMRMGQNLRVHLESRKKIAHGRCVAPEETIARLEGLIRPRHGYWLHEETVAPSLHWTALFLENLLLAGGPWSSRGAGSEGGEKGVIEPPWQAVKEWIPDDEPNLNWFNQERDTTGAVPDQFDQLVRRSLGEGVTQPQVAP